MTCKTETHFVVEMMTPDAREICGPLGSEQGCSVCERCRAEVLLAEAEFRENGLLETNQKLRQWLSVIESFPSGIVPDRIAIDDIKKIARNALGETTSKQASSPTHRNTR